MSRGNTARLKGHFWVFVVGILAGCVLIETFNSSRVKYDSADSITSWEKSGSDDGKNISTFEVIENKPNEAINGVFARSQQHDSQTENIVTNRDDDDSKNVASEEKTIKLCNRVIPSTSIPMDWLEGMLNHSMQFGVSNWERNFSNILIQKNKTFGQTGNQIREFLHAFDMARDNGMALAICPHDAPLERPLTTLFPNLNLLNQSSPDWQKTFENFFGVLVLDSNKSHKSIPKGANYTRVRPKDLFFYESTKHTLQQRKAHRHFIFQKLYNLTAKEMAERPYSEETRKMCSSLYAYFGENSIITKENSTIPKKITQKYTVIHNRLLPEYLRISASEGMGVDAQASTDLPPDLISSILDPLDMVNNSIVMITDGTNTNASDRLAADPLIGPLFQVVPPEFSSMISDVMLAIVSNVFIGNPASTLSWFIAMVRYALGIDHSFLFYRKREVGGGQWIWETFCDEDCLPL